MNSKPRLLDLFCGAGGATKGYQRAGFYVVGVDNKPQPHYCGDEFYLADALEFPLEGYDAYHASPPCQFASTCTPMRYRGNHKNLIPDIRSRLQGMRKPFVIENVPNARQHLICPFMLCGSMFGLNIRRHRYFETYPEMFTLQTPCNHPKKGLVYVSGSTGSSKAKFHRFDFSVAERRKALEIPWMTDKELDEAIPPAYTEYIGKYLINEL